MANRPRNKDFADAVVTLAAFIDADDLSGTFAALEHAVDGRRRRGLRSVIEDRGISPELLTAAMTVRERLGRLNDVIHAAAILLVLPKLLEPDERMRRPSLAAGNDRSRPYDVDTSRRVAEFKLSKWRGSDATRKRQTFKDLVHLAADDSGRRAQLFVLGPRPIQFLRTCRSPAAWGLDRSPPTRLLFQDRFGALDMQIRDFTAGPGAHVELIDLEVAFPKLLRPIL